MSLDNMPIGGLWQYVIKKNALRTIVPKRIAQAIGVAWDLIDSREHEHMVA
jgi:hypothetical protein